MKTTGVIIIAGAILLFIYVLIKVLQTLFKPSEFISSKIKSRADRKFSKLFFRFKKEHNRNPNHDELFRIVINASHITIRLPGKRGHFERQKIRKYLLEKHEIVKNYKIK
jgi:hypothetical protein